MNKLNSIDENGLVTVCEGVRKVRVDHYNNEGELVHTVVNHDTDTGFKIPYPAANITLYKEI